MERQQLLADILNPPCIEILRKVGTFPGGRCLDLGCGQGNTTRMLATQLATSETVGLDFDSSLVAFASAHPENGFGIRFEQGSATELPFADASFDVVFVRYLLVHLAEPALVIQEIQRVLKPGGRAIAYEPDFTVDFSEPESWGITQMGKVWRGMFPSPHIGRKLAGMFRKVGMTVEVGGFQGVEDGLGPYRRIYRMTLEAMKIGILAKGIETEEEYEAHLKELVRLESDHETVIAKFPDIWVIATK